LTGSSARCYASLGYRTSGNKNSRISGRIELQGDWLGIGCHHALAFCGGVDAICVFGGTMRVLLSAVGTRGDVQPIVAVAVQLRALGHQARLCVPPNFVGWVEGKGFEAVAVGVEMRAPAKGAPPPTPAELARLRAAMPDLISDQFDAVEGAVDGCDVVLGANAHQYAARSIAALRGLPCVTALYAPVTLLSPDHAPPPLPGARWSPGGDPAANLALWDANRAAWNQRALERVNHNRQRRGLAAIDDVLDHNLSDHPWLATDVALAPLPATPGRTVTCTGAWILDDDAPLDAGLAAFLDDGAPPVFLGFGSMPAPPGAGRDLVSAARAVGRRAVFSGGGATLGF
jgi:vancomycin aglycone glucosyltransferase